MYKIALKTIPLIIAFAAITSCNTTPVNNIKKQDNFQKEVEELRNYFHIPGLSVIVLEDDEVIYENYTGFANLEDNIPMDASTTIPMASLTKMFTGILMMKAVKNGTISLDELINKYKKNVPLSDAIKLKHVLSHTSQGEVGENFYYSSRFSWLGNAIQQAYGKPIAEVVQNEIISLLGLTNTYPLISEANLKEQNRKIAQPYNFEGEAVEGFIDYGYSASAGIASTVRDLAILSQSMDDNTLISNKSWQIMSSPFNRDLPYGYGIFSQKFDGMDLIWAHGQYDSYSSIFLKIPNRNLTFIIAGNNNLIGDPARLIYGDITNSLFALSFLKNYVYEQVNTPLLKTTEQFANKVPANNIDLARKILLAEAISESFLAMYEEGRGENSKAILRQVFSIYPDYESYGDLNLLHNLNMLKLIAQHRGHDDFIEFDEQLQAIAKKLLKEDKTNPYANSYLADFYNLTGDSNNARKHYSRIANAQNYTSNWYTEEAKAWLENNK